MKFKLIMAFLFLILVSGCAQQEPAGETFVASDDALSFEFLEGQPPERIFGGNGFDAAVFVSNKGGYDIVLENVELTLNDHNFGVNRSYARQTNTQNLTGIKRAPSGELILGGSDVVSWENLNYNSLRPITEEIGTPLSVDACYRYSTIATLKLCVVAGSSPPCNDDEEKSVENSGAPIKISEFTELKSTKMGNSDLVKVSFKFKLAKTGDEKYKIYAPRPACSDVMSEDLNNVHLYSWSFPGATGPRALSCNVDSNLRVIPLESESLESDEVFCTLIVGASGSYEDNLQLNFNYLIKQGLSKNLQVIPI